MNDRKPSHGGSGGESRFQGAWALVLIGVLLPALVWAGTEHLTGGLWLSGQADAPVKIEVFSDYQCPHCRAFYLGTIKPLIAELTSEQKDSSLYIVYHDFPLDGHRYARQAASYALAAERLGHDSWLRVTDALYLEQAQWAQDGDIEGVISKVLDGAELAFVKRQAADPSIEQTIRTEILLAQSRQVSATPTFFISLPGGRQERINGAVPYELLRGYLAQYLK